MNDAIIGPKTNARFFSYSSAFRRLISTSAVTRNNSPKVFLSLLALIAFSLASSVSAQEASTTPRRAKSDVDRAMIRALEKEYEEGDDLDDPDEPQSFGPDRPSNEDSTTIRRSNPETARNYRNTPRVNNDEFVVVDEEERNRDLWTMFRLEAVWWAAGFGDTDVTSRSGGLGNTFNTTDDSIAEYGEDDYYGTLLYKLDIGFHPVVSLNALFYMTDLKSEQTLSNTSFIFDDQGFTSGDRLKSRFRITAAELSVNVHVINLSWVRLDILLGGRYMKFELEYKRANSNTPVARQRFEGLTPMLGIGYVLRPTGWLHFYGSAQVGAIQYDSSEENSRGRRSNIDEKYLAIIVLDAGMRLDLFDSIELSLGARIEAFEAENYKGNEGEHAIEGVFGGPYAGIAFKF